MNTELELSQSKLPATPFKVDGTFMDDLGISSDDIVAHKLFLMHPGSPWVKEGKYKAGEIVNIDTGVVLGSQEKPVEIIPLKREIVWVVSDISEKIAKTLRVEAYTPENKGLPYEDTEESKTVLDKMIRIRRDLSHKFTVLLKSEADIGESFPATILFKRTSAPAGKNMASLMARQAAAGRNPLHYSVILSVVKQSGDGLDWLALQTSFGTKLTDAAIKDVDKWFAFAKAKKIIDTESNLEDVPF